ncbi:MAG: hypothetical protein ACKON8_02155, partial [Planctomycetota bacterium]
MFCRLAALTAAVLLVSAPLAPVVSITAAEPATVTFVEAAPISAAGDVVTAIGLRAEPGVRPEAAAVVVLVDTSASQAGAFRERSLAAARRILAAGGPRDVFMVAAVDVSCEPLTASFLEASNPGLEQSLGQLAERTPLGSTDFVAGLSAAADLLADRSEARFIVYVGDGPGIEGVEPGEFFHCVNRLADERIAVSGIGVGSSVNWPLLAATAAGTGGLFVQGASDADSAETVAKGHVHSILWPGPTTCMLESGTTVRLLPSRLPPLRADRDTVVFADGNAGRGSLDVMFRTLPEADAQPEADAHPGSQLPIPAAAPRESNAYLVELVRNALPTDGVFLPLLGRESLDVAKSVFRREAAGLALLARQAEATGARDAAVRVAEAARRRERA